MIFERSLEPFHIISLKAGIRVEETKEAGRMLSGNNQVRRKHEVSIRWQFPNLDWVKINSDGSIRNAFLAGCGQVAQDGTGA